MSCPYDVRCGDSLRLLTELDHDSVDGVITDCPYSSGGMTRGDRTDRAHTKYVRSDASNRTLGHFEGDGRDQRGWTFWCSLWYSECLRATKLGGILCTFTDWRQLPSTTDAVQAGGWVWRGIVPWNKGEGARPQQGRFRAQCEYIVFATKGPHQPYGDDAPCLPGFYSIAAPPAVERYHITQKPVALMQQLVRLVPPGGVVLDPFSGSGSLGVGALREGRAPILFEIVPENAELTRERLAAEADGLDLDAARAGQMALFEGSR
ncbi:MAG: DNA-methyltransferase [Planctomycetota bacterium]|jgi:site-specific DNA-methyltransferase (adenine-specific)